MEKLEATELLTELVERAIVVNDKLSYNNRDCLIDVYGVAYDRKTDNMVLVGMEYNYCGDDSYEEASTVEVPAAAFFDDAKLDEHISDLIRAEEERYQSYQAEQKRRRYEEFLRMKAEFGE